MILWPDSLFKTKFELEELIELTEVELMSMGLCLPQKMTTKDYRKATLYILFENCS